MRRLFFYLVLSSIIFSCVKDKPKAPATPKMPEVSDVKAPEVPEVIEDSVPEPPKPPVEEVKEVKKPVVKKKKPKVVNKKREDYKSLIFNVQLGINPDRKNWVLFKNGTYMVFPNNTAEKDARRAAKKLLSNYKGGSITITKSAFAKGWIASTSTGIYNYIDRDAFGKGIPKQENILKKGQDNLTTDAKNLEIIYINRPKE
ncbi:hypothetical protein [uncultured Dokdonia sp.]|uniref:hypothetical protein n=1 Tax=uncultured Dokdonia sp. TaxID=575653 RepID=UPI002603EF4F|nr:hypothetical protein [uncultured Dokdonia sp.]